MDRNRNRLHLALAAAVLLAPGLAFAQPPPGEGGPPPEPGQRHRIVLRNGEGAPPDLPRIAPLLALGRGFIGVELVDLTPELRRHFGAPEDAGVMVARVREGSPAAAAGIAVGDIITRVDDQPVGSSFDLARAVRRKDAGATSEIEARRDGRSQSFRVTVEERARREVDLGEAFAWRPREGEEPPRVLFFDKEHGGPEMLPPEAMERLGKRLEGIDWDRLAIDPERTARLEKRLEELEKKLSELRQKLDDANRKQR